MVYGEEHIEYQHFDDGDFLDASGSLICARAANGVTILVSSLQLGTPRHERAARQPGRPSHEETRTLTKR